MLTGESAYYLDLQGCNSIRQLQQLLCAHMRAHPELPWVVGVNWDQVRGEERKIDLQLVRVMTMRGCVVCVDVVCRIMWCRLLLVAIPPATTWTKSASLAEAMTPDPCSSGVPAGMWGLPTPQVGGQRCYCYPTLAFTTITATISTTVSIATSAVMTVISLSCSSYYPIGLTLCFLNHASVEC